MSQQPTSFVAQNSPRVPLQSLESNAAATASPQGGLGLADLLSGTSKDSSSPKKPPSSSASASSYTSSKTLSHVSHAHSATINTAVSVTESVDVRLLKDRVEHLERERSSMSRQLHQREEKDRTRKLKLERYEKAIKEMSAHKTESDSKLEGLREERDGFARQLSTLAASAAASGGVLDGAAGEASGNSLAANLAEALPLLACTQR